MHQVPATYSTLTPSSPGRSI